MKQEIFHSDQPIFQSDLDRLQTSKEEALTERQRDLFGYGIVIDSQLLAETIPFKITVSGAYVNIETGVAYDPAGERIIISDPSEIYNAANLVTATDDGVGGTTITPQSTGCNTVPITNGSVNYIYVSYVKTTDPSVFSLQDVTNKRLFTKADDGYRIDVVVDAGPTVGDPDTFKPNVNAIFLGVVDTVDVAHTTSRINMSLKKGSLVETVPDALSTLGALGKPYAVGQEVTFTDHIEAVGTGVVTPTNPHGLAIADLSGSFTGKTAEVHELLFHESGISGDQTLTTSGLYGSAALSGGAIIPPTYARDTFWVRKLLATEAVQVAGVTISSADLPEDYLIYFVDTAGNLLDTGTYTVYLDSLSKSLKLAANGSPVNTSYRVYGMTSGTFTNLTVLPILSVTAAASNFLLWEVYWDNTGVSVGDDNFLSVTDKRFFGTVGSGALRRDSETDTVTIDHNVDIAGNVQVGGSLNVLGFVNNIVPAGTIVAFAGVTPPPGWLECDGTPLPISGNYTATWGTFNVATLYTTIQASWGDNGVGTFRIPDLRGSFLRGWNHGAADAGFNDPDNALRGTPRHSNGATGDNLGSYQVDDFKEHTHDYLKTALGTSNGSNSNYISATSGTTSGASTIVTGNETRPRNAYVMYIIKAV